MLGIFGAPGPGILGDKDSRCVSGLLLKWGLLYHMKGEKQNGDIHRMNSQIFRCVDPCTGACLARGITLDNVLAKKSNMETGCLLKVMIGKPMGLSSRETRC